MTRRHVFGWTTANLVVLVLALFPVFWLLMLSLDSPATIGDGRLIPATWSLENYKGIFQQTIFTRALVDSIGIALISTLLAVSLATMAAYAITRLDFPGKRALLTLALAIVLFPPISIVGPLFDMWRDLGLFNTWPGLIIPYMTFTLPLAIYVLAPSSARSHLTSRRPPRSTAPPRARRSCGSSSRSPRPACFTTVILVFIFAWNDFVFAFALTATSSAQTVPAAIALFPGASQFTQPTGSIAAAAIVVTVPIVVMVMFFQRRIVAGLTAGAVKG